MGTSVEDSGKKDANLGVRSQRKEALKNSQPQSFERFLKSEEGKAIIAEIFVELMDDDTIMQLLRAKIGAEKPMPLAADETKTTSSPVDWESKYNELKTKFDNLNKEITTIRGQRDGYCDELRKINASYKELFPGSEEINSERLKQSVSQLRGEYSTLQNETNSKISTLEGERDSFRQSLQNIGAVYKELFPGSEEINSERLKQSVSQLRGEYSTLQNETNSKISTLEGERDSFRQSLQNIGAVYKELFPDSEEINPERLKQSVSQLRGEYSTLQNETNSKISTLEGERDSFRQSLQNIGKELEKVRGELAKRFPEGWEIYEKYRLLNSKVLSGKDFEAFICSGARMDNLDLIWDEARDSKKNGEFETADTLWATFQYAVELVNKSQGKTAIEILQPQIGDRYDSDVHNTTGTNSKAQGKVLEIILPGFLNKNSGKAKKKSIVRVG